MTSCTISNEDILLKMSEFNLSFKSRSEGRQTLKDIFINTFDTQAKKQVVEKNNDYIFEGLNLEVKTGDVIGIVGNNGVGKSTLCRVVSGHYKSQNNFECNGKVRAIFEGHTVIMPELSGRDNIKLLTQIVYSDLSKKERVEIVESACEFSGLKDLLNKPIKNYSKGMVTRLTLSVISQKSSDILVLDEVCSGADIFFTRKVMEQFKKIMSESKAVLIVSHQLELLRSLCNRMIVLKDRNIAYDGNPTDGIQYYVDHCSNSEFNS